MRNKRGFTLIEILVVIIIIGIMAGMTLLVFGDFGLKRKTFAAAEQFISTIKLVQQQALLENNTWGIALQNNQYVIYQYSDNNWIIPNQSVFKMRYFPLGTHTKFRSSIKLRSNFPNIVITPFAGMTPFQLALLNNQDQIFIKVIGFSSGSLRIVKSAL